MREDNRTEFKREYTEDIRRTVIAFANCDGGSIYIGIENDGHIIGVEDADDVMLRVASNIRDNIAPDVSLLANIENIVIQSKNVIRVDVIRGTARPYYYKSKGIRPEGVYVRLGAATVPAGSSTIIELIKESGSYKYEEEVSINQDLTFEYTEGVFEECGIEFKENTLRNLHCINEYEQYTNLALLLSDQCPHIIKLATFQGRDKMIFRDRIIADGSVFKQINTSMEYIGKYNRLRAEIVGYKREDKYDYHLDCIRELLFNAVIHRDYSYDSPILVSVLEDRIEVVNIGGLYGNLSQDELGTGISACRNKKLAEIFYRLKLVEAFGTGIMKINAVYKGCHKQATFTAGNNSFKAVLPNMNIDREDEYDAISRARENALLSYVAYSFCTNDNMAEREKTAIEYIRSNGSANRGELQELLGVSQATVILLLREMRAKELIKAVGAGKNTRYVCS